MPEELRERVKQTEPFEDPGQEAMLSLMAAASSVRGVLENVHEQHGLFGSQYNILRILAGGPPEGYPRCEIIDRMINRGPDVTRLVDPLEERGLVERQRSDEDRRMVLHRITEQGRALLRDVSPDLGPVQEAFNEALSEKEMKQLSQLCATVYRRFDESPPCP